LKPATTKLNEILKTPHVLILYFFRKYVPQLRNFPAKYIYDPWNAPLEVQRAAGCIIGKDYPMRIIDHEEAKLVCAKRLREMVGELQEGMSTSIS
jgi:cryptochrome